MNEKTEERPESRTQTAGTENKERKHAGRPCRRPFVNPVRVFDEITRVDAEAMVRNVFVFRKFTIPDDKALVMEVYERNGGRHQRFEIENSRLVGAR